MVLKMSNQQYIYGIHAVSSLLESQKRPLKQLFISEERQDKRIQQILVMAKKVGVTIVSMSSKKMNQKFSDVSHQGIVGVTERLAAYTEKDLTKLLAEHNAPYFILILDGVTDPHNLGACLRTAEAAGIQLVIAPKDNNVGITPIVSKVACGAAEVIPFVQVTNLVRSINVLKESGVWVYGAAGEAKTSLYEQDFSASIALVMGAEGTGMRRLTRENCDGLFSIPMAGTVSSLNVSVAAGVSLFEAVRQRQK